MFHNLFFGLSDLSVILFITGIVLLVAEMFHPGFGVFGFAGLGILVLDIVISARSFLHGLALSLFLAGVILVLFITFLILASTGNLPRGLILKNSEDTRSGFLGVPDLGGYAGLPGIARTALRPAGSARIGEDNLSVVTEGEFIEKGAAIRVKKVEGSRVVVGRDESS